MYFWYHFINNYYPSTDLFFESVFGRFQGFHNVRLHSYFSSRSRFLILNHRIIIIIIFFFFFFFFFLCVCVCGGGGGGGGGAGGGGVGFTAFSRLFHLFRADR